MILDVLLETVCGTMFVRNSAGLTEDVHCFYSISEQFMLISKTYYNVHGFILSLVEKVT